MNTPSKTYGEAIARLLKIAGIPFESGWAFNDATIPGKIDQAADMLASLKAKLAVRQLEYTALYFEHSDTSSELRAMKNREKRQPLSQPPAT